MKSIAVSQVPEELRSRIVRDSVAFFDLPDPPVADAAWQIVNPYSLALCIRLRRADWQCRVFAKISRWPNAAEGELPGMMRKEFEVLQALSGGETHFVDADPAYAGTVQPFAFYPDIPSVVTVAAEGVTLRRRYARDARLWSGRSERASLIGRVELCGRWLAGFQDSTAAGSQAFDIDGFLAYCRIRLDRLTAQKPHVLSVRQAEALTSAADRLARTSLASDLRVSGRHNDFASHNIIACTSGGVRVLDFTMYDEGEDAFDICNFWFELEMLKSDPSYSRALLSQLQSVFLSTCGGVDPESPDFLLARLRYSVNRLLNAYLGAQPRLRNLSPHWHLSTRGILQWLREFAVKHGSPTASAAWTTERPA